VENSSNSYNLENEDIGLFRPLHKEKPTRHTPTPVNSRSFSSLPLEYHNIKEESERSGITRSRSSQISTGIIGFSCKYGHQEALSKRISSNEYLVENK
jgi:hypothetical protein